MVVCVVVCVVGVGSLYEILRDFLVSHLLRLGRMRDSRSL